MHRSVTTALLAVSLGACTSVTDLSETPPTFISPSTFYARDADAVAAVNGAYQPLMDWNLWRQPSWISVACDEPELVCQNWMAGGFEGKQAGQWYVSRPWTGAYQLIARANDIVANVGGSAAITPAVKKLTVGQALFLRGYSYFDLARRFGGAPLRLEPYQPSDAAGTLARASVDLVFKQAAADLKAAADSLPASYTEALGGGRPTQLSALGMLAKVYMHLAGAEVAGTAAAGAKQAYLDSARLTAQRVVASGGTALEANYMDLFDVSKQNTSKEILFSVQAASAGQSGSELPGFFAPSQFSLAGGGASGFISLRRDFLRNFEPTDARIRGGSATFVRWQYSTSASDKGLPAILLDSLPSLNAVKDSVTNYGAWTERCGNYGQNTHLIVTRNAATGRFDSTYYSVSGSIFSAKYTDPNSLSKTANTNNPIVLRYADVLLVYAEAENEVNGPSAAAYNALNQVRARSGATPRTGLTQATFRQAVWDERQRELYGEFQSRFDLVREGRWLQVMSAPSTVFPNDGACRPREAYQILFPLPQSEIAGNPLIKQNPGY